MTAKRFYGVTLVMLVVGLALIVLFPSESLVILSIAIPVMIGGTAIATAYLAKVFHQQPIPRSRFFRMLVEMFFALLVIGIWVGYLSTARVIEKAVANGEHVLFVLPAPPPSVSAPISALVVVVVFAWPIRFGLEVYARRRLSGRIVSTAEDDDLALDRNDDD